MARKAAASVSVVLLLTMALSSFCFAAPLADEGKDALTLDALKNAEYISEWPESGKAKLTDGVYKQKYDETSASELVIKFDQAVFGDLNGDGVEDAAVILVTDPGGSGTFYDLAAVLNTDGQPVNVATRNLGDRVQIQSFSIESGQILVKMLTQGPDDPMSSPTKEVAYAYKLIWDQLAQGSADGTGLSLETLGNAEYKLEYPSSGTAKLTDGVYKEKYTEDSASQLVITLYNSSIGDLNGDGADDAAVILVSAPGGSGTFLDLAAVLNESGKPVNVATTFLGDRTQVKSFSVSSGYIDISAVTHGEDDPMCCPTKQVSWSYQLQGNELVDANEAAPAATESPAPPDSGGDEQPQRIQFAAGATTAQVKGTLPAEGVVHYVLWALAGQTMTLKVTPGDQDNPQAILIIYGKDGTVLMSDHAGAVTWSGPLPSTQDYLIDLRSVVQKSVDYALDVEIPPLSK